MSSPNQRFAHKAKLVLEVIEATGKRGASMDTFLDKIPGTSDSNGQWELAVAISRLREQGIIQEVLVSGRTCFEITPLHRLAMLGE